VGPDPAWKVPPDGETVTRNSTGRKGDAEPDKSLCVLVTATGAELLVLWGEVESDGAARAGATTRTAGRPNQPTGPTVTIPDATPLGRSPPF
jgi:hypothetical protein